jgi:uncharacterized membrane protein (UPF0182 family)
MNAGGPGTNGGEARDQETRQTRSNPLKAVKWGLAVLGIVLLFVLLSAIKSAYTDWLWFDNVGFISIYARILTTRIWLFFASALFFAMLLVANIYIADRFSKGEPRLPIPAEAMRMVNIATRAGISLMAFFMSLTFGLAASGRWETFIRFMNNTPFGVQDPLFHRDISFYIGTLPVLNFVQGWLLGAVIAITIAVVGVYLLNFSIRGINLQFTPAIRRHLAALGAFLMLVIAFKYYMDIYGLVLSDRGVVFGAAYTDTHAMLPALRLMIGITLAAALLLIASTFVRGQRLMLGAFGLWAGSAIIVLVIFPAVFQRLVVAPNELKREEPYIQRNIEATRAGFGLERISETPFPVSYGLSAETVIDNPETIGNIRLWDYGPLRDTYNQLQFIRLYYTFLDVDVDRYVVDAAYRQVLLSARELFPENLPSEAQRWVNRKLQYTHGYGVAMSPVNEFTDEGRPTFFLKDIPPEGDLEVTRPEIYYGENTGDYVIVNTHTQEFDYPAGEDTPVYVQYQGDGGVPLSSFFQRLVYAWHMGDINVLISNQITSESRIQYRRQIQERIHTLAPFLQIDGDPYLVVANGRLWWIQDAYTTTHNYPYSTRYELASGTANYIRNSVKVVVDPYHGAVSFYVIDPQDPMLQIYRGAFPALFTDFEEMPEALKSHIRYPEDLFLIQSNVYLQYHMQDPRVFFNKEDQWTIPTETFFGSEKAIEPYYVIMKIPGEEKEEFALILPFTPKGKPNMVAWLAARSDMPQYGELLAFLFPKDRQIDGPSQVEARIDNDPVISQQFTLWGQAGSRVRRGNLLTVPIGQTVIFVEPVFLQAENFPFPELKQVIVATTEKVVMRPTLEEGLIALLEGTPPVVVPPPDGGDGDIPAEQIQQEIDTIRQAIEGLKEALQQMEGSLERLNETIGGESQ